MNNMANRENGLPMVMTIQDLVAYTGLKDYAIRRMIADGEVEYIRSGKRFYVVVESLMRQIKTGTAQ